VSFAIPLSIRIHWFTSAMSAITGVLKDDVSFVGIQELQMPIIVESVCSKRRIGTVVPKW